MIDAIILFAGLVGVYICGYFHGREGHAEHEPRAVRLLPPGSAL